MNNPFADYAGSEFVQIENMYAASVFGPARNKEMFFGRDELIKNIINSLTTTNTKCIVLYGQKKSGKSSVLYHLEQQLKEHDVFCVRFSLGEIIAESLTSAAFFYKIIVTIKRKLEEISQGGTTPKIACPTLSELEESGSLAAIETLQNFQKSCKETQAWEHKRLIVMIDEFTYLYTAILKKEISDSFMKNWKNIIETGLFNAVLVGQDVMPKFQARYSNEFGVAGNIRLSYLDTVSAQQLIERPVWDKQRDRSRYLGESVAKIIDLTAGSPYYIQIFCNQLVKYMNAREKICVTEADIREVTEELVSGNNALDAMCFDGLLTAGDADLEEIPANDTIKVVQEIAKMSEKHGYCSRKDINVLGPAKDDQIIQDLERRKVLVVPQTNFYKIAVQLFQKWLLKH